MIFNSFQFIVLFPFIFLLYYVIPEKLTKVRNLFLLIVSYLLYMQWKPIYALVLLGITVATYYTALYIESQKPSKPRLSICLIIILLPLFMFKYADFINNSICDLFSMFGVQCSISGLNWAIPIGISFFTFQAIGYVLDVYYKKLNAEHDFMIYALFVSFFPCILSGPINKASLVIPQLKNLRVYFDYAKAVEGLKMLLWGMFMKVVVADRAALYVDTVLLNYENYTGTSCFIASLLYTIQIYTDFAGYSLMAIGVGKTLGFELTENFRRPYFAVSVTDFWHRWHISLSTWLKDYIYIPMGGSRCSKVRNYWNIFVTFLISGIWHGANWTFIVWGVLHGFFQIVEKMTGQQKCNYGWVGKTIKIFVTFITVNFIWIFFRMPTLADACAVIARMFDPSLPKQIYIPPMPTLPLIAMGTTLLLLKDLHDEFLPNRAALMDARATWVRWASYIALIIIILVTGVFSSDQFIYAKF